jgi:AcrR family transcriptional regulator
MSNINTNNSQKTLDKRIIRSKKAIRDAFFAELQKKEYSKITITDIAIAAGINRKTFYSYYDGVESLFEEIETELINKFRPLLSTLDLKSTTFSARSFFNEFSKLARDDFEIYHLLNQCGQLPHLFGKVQELVVDIIMSQVEVEIDDPHEKARLMLMSEYVAAGILSMVSHWIANPGDISLDEFTDIAGNLTLYGLSKTVVPQSDI